MEVRKIHDNIGLRVQASTRSSSFPPRTRIRLVALIGGTVRPARRTVKNEQLVSNYLPMTVNMAAVVTLKTLSKNLFFINLHMKYSKRSFL